MDGFVFLAVIVAAGFHASWNAMVKASVDKYLAMTAIVLGHTPLALVSLGWVAVPAVASWPHIVASTILHVGYQLYLLRAYRVGDLSLVYPIARGTAPVIVALVAVFLLGEALSPVHVLAVGLISIGIISLVFVRDSDGLRNSKAASLALITSGFVAGYSLVDGLGARLSGAPVAFYAWGTILNAVVFAIVMAMTQPGLLQRVWPEARTTALIGGSASFIAYAIAIWAFTQAPIAVVAALRETSIMFALFIGVIVMKERFSLIKLVSTVLTVSGAILLGFAH